MNQAKLEKAGISPESCQLLLNLVERYRKLQERPQHKVPHVVCAGMYNAGKSTLLNTLIGREVFSVGDIPTTKQITTLELEDRVYVDTPGLNAQPEDDQVTVQALQKADLILFASTAENGGLLQAEAKWLQWLKAQFGQRMDERLIFVMTQCGQMEDDALDRVEKKYMQDLQAVLDFFPTMHFRIDALVWHDGVCQNEPLLRTAGGVDDLLNTITKRCEAIRQSCIREYRQDLKDAQNSTLAAIVELCSQCSRKMDAVTSKYDNKSYQVAQLIKKTDQTIHALEQTRVSVSVEYISLDHGTTSFKDKSESAVKRSARDRLKLVVNRYLTKATSALKAAERDTRRNYGNIGMESAYFKICDSANQSLELLRSSLQQAGFLISPPREITFHIDVTDMAEELSQDTMNAIGYFPSADDYAYDIDVSDCSTEELKNGIFGSRWVTVTKYRATIHSAIYEAKRDIENEIEDWTKSTRNWIDRAYLKPCLKQVVQQAEEQLEEINKAVMQQIKEQLASQKEPYQDALAELRSLEQEVCKCQM